MITDTEIQENVLAELSWEPALDATEITVTANNGVVTLRGKVHHYGERRAAEQAAVKIKGVKSLINELQVTLCGEEQPSDEEIADEILRMLNNHTAIPPGQIKVRVIHGFVYLEGELAWNFQKEAVFTAVRHLKGIVGISNLIRIRPHISQAAVKTQVRQALYRYAGLEADGIKVETDGNEVVITGKVRSWSEKQAVEKAVWASSGVKSVRNNLIID